MSAWACGDSLAVKVDLAGVLIKDHVLQHRAEADGIIDLRLRSLLEANALSVAAALNVEHAVIAPAVLVISNQGPGRVSGKGSLSSTCENISLSTVENYPLNLYQGVKMHAKTTLGKQHAQHSCRKVLLTCFTPEWYT